MFIDFNNFEKKFRKIFKIFNEKQIAKKVI